MIKCIFTFIVLGFFIIITSCSVFDSNKYGNEELWVKHQLNQINAKYSNRSDTNITGHIINASVCREKGDFAMAILEYENALKYDTSATILFSIAECYFNIGKYDKAIMYSLMSLTFKPNFEQSYSLLGKSYIAKYDIINAIISLEYANKINKNEINLLLLARMYEFKDIKKSIEIYYHIADMYLNNNVLDHIAELSANEITSDKFLEIYSKIWNIYPDNFHIAISLTGTIFKANKYKLFFENIEKFDHHLDIDELENLYNFVMSSILEINKTSNIISNDDINILLNKIDNRFNFSEISIYNAGRLSLLINDTIKTTNYLNKIISAPDATDDTKIKIALLFYENKDFEKTKSILNEAFLIDTNNWKYPFWIGVTEYLDSNYNEALNYFLTSINLDSTNVIVWENIANTAQNVHIYEISDYYYEKILKENPNNPIICNNYAFSLCNREINLSKALELAQKALSIDSTSPEFLDTYGWINFKLGNYPISIEYIDKSLKIDNSKSEVFEHLADIYFALNSLDNALRAINAALNISPDNENLINKKNNIIKKID